MPKVMNGHSHEETNPDFVLVTKILNAYKSLWITQMGELTMEHDPMKVSRLGLVALTQWAAIVAVDIGMKPDQYAAICEAQFKGAHDRAPKFG